MFTDWVMIDARGMPTRVPDEFPERFPAPPGAFEPTRIPPPPADLIAAAAELRFGVRSQELDPQGHANNAAYLDWVDEAVDVVAPGRTDVLPRHYALEYLLPVPPGTRLVASAWVDGGSLGYLLRDEAGRDIFRARLAGSEPAVPGA